MLEFNKEKHQYKIDGLIVSSVTQTLDEAGLTSYFSDPKETPFYLQRGTDVDATIRLYLQGKLSDPGDSAHQLSAFKSFESNFDFVMRSVNVRVYSDRFFYAGTFDIIGWIDGELCLIDIKAGQYNPWYDLQLAAYQQAWNEMNPKEKVVRRFVLSLFCDGSYKLHECKNKGDINVFCAALSINNWKRRTK